MSDAYINHPPNEDLIRMKHGLERQVAEIEYDLKRNAEKREKLLRDLETTKTGIISVQAYLDFAEKESKK